ncbi:MAG: phosphotransferase [Firmicutes bacterium]|nr:phosphotransferase [Bacillota bacterium]
MDNSTSWQIESIAQPLLLYLQERLSGRDNVVIKDLARITTGWETEVYSFRLVDRGNELSLDLILRIYPGDDAQVKSQREFGIMDLLKRSNFSVPAVFFLETGTSRLPKPFMIMERIWGPSLREMFGSHMLDPKGAELVALFCRLFTDLHRWNWCEHADALAQIPSLSCPLHLPAELERWRKSGGSGWEPAFDLLLAQYPKITCQSPCLTHGDFHPDNIILEGGLKPYIIDWGGARLQDFRIDLAWTMLLLGTYGSWELGDMVLRQYETILGKAIPDMPYFLTVAALKRLLSIYLSVTVGAEQLGMREGAAAMMVKDLPHLQKVYEVFQDHAGVELPPIRSLLDDMAASTGNQ